MLYKKIVYLILNWHFLVRYRTIITSIRWHYHYNVSVVYKAYNNAQLRCMERVRPSARQSVCLMQAAIDATRPYSQPSGNGGLVFLKFWPFCGVWKLTFPLAV